MWMFNLVISVKCSSQVAVPIYTPTSRVLILHKWNKHFAMSCVLSRSTVFHAGKMCRNYGIPYCWVFTFLVSRTWSPSCHLRGNDWRLLLPCTKGKASSRGAWWHSRLSSSRDCWVRMSPAGRYPRQPNRSQQRTRRSALRGREAVTDSLQQQAQDTVHVLSHEKTDFSCNIPWPGIVCIFGFSLL